MAANLNSKSNNSQNLKRQTIYEYARSQMQEIVAHLLRLSKKTKNFSSPDGKLWDDALSTTMLLTGKNYHINDIAGIPSKSNAWLARAALPFQLERAATGVLYQRLKLFTDELIAYAFESTRNFKSITQEWVQSNPQCLPVLMHVMGVFSKQDLKKNFGTVSDRRLSVAASEKIVAFLQGLKGAVPNQSQIKERIKATVEGIVRDLVGRLLLEQFVSTALDTSRVPFLREAEYSSLPGVVYDFRADFVVPDATSPRAFIEVRKSSARHASLYAKDKMFSAINWKGQHQHCLGILIVDGPWTETTLQIMATIFDYVVPIERVGEVADNIRKYLDGDMTVLQWLIEFKVFQYRHGGKPIPARKVLARAEELEDEPDLE